jgi:hypothetical protein
VLPRGIVHRHVEQGQQGRQNRLTGTVEGEQLARHLLEDLAEIVPSPRWSLTSPRSRCSLSSQAVSPSAGVATPEVHLREPKVHRRHSFTRLLTLPHPLFRFDIDD